MKRGIIIFIILVLAGAGLRFGWNKIQPSAEKNSAQVELSKEKLTVQKNSISSPSLSISDKEKLALKAKALAIISRPILVRIQLADSVKNQAIEKIKQINESIRANYDLDSQWLELAAYRKLIGDYDGAIEAWNFLSLIRPKNFVSYNNLGDLYAFNLKDYEKGEQNFLQSISNNPQNINAYMQLITIYEATNQLNKIEPILLLGIKSNSANPILNILLARHYVAQKRFKEALNNYQAALKLDSNNQSLRGEMDKFKAEQGF